MYREILVFLFFLGIYFAAHVHLGVVDTFAKDERRGLVQNGSKKSASRKSSMFTTSTVLLHGCQNIMKYEKYSTDVKK